MSTSYQATYWNKKGRHQILYSLLFKMIPDSGECRDAKGANKALDKLRRAGNCYYDLFNNGLCNRAKESRALFGFGAPRGWTGGRHGVLFEHPDIAKYDEAIDRFILDAAREQGIEPGAPTESPQDETAKLAAYTLLPMPIPATQDEVLAYGKACFEAGRRIATPCAT